MSPALFHQTPSITAFDSRGLAVRTLDYLRHPDEGTDARVRITRHRYSLHGVLAGSSDARLHELGKANLECVSDLAGQPVYRRSVDAGAQVTLRDGARRPAIVFTRIGIGDPGEDDLSQAVTLTWQYEDDTLPGRVLSVTEQVVGDPPRISERFVWGGASTDEQGFNLAGQCVRHYGPEGLLRIDSVALGEVPLREARRLLAQADSAQVIADWQGADVDSWDGLLAEDTWPTAVSVDALGALLSRTDARNHRRRVAYDVTGLLKRSWVSLDGAAEQAVVSDCAYAANGSKLFEEHGNQVLTRFRYEADTERLAAIRIERPAGHPAGAGVLQDLRYEYDPCGNVVQVMDASHASRFWRNQRVAPQTLFSYDSLYQLASAQGREMAAIAAAVDDVTYTQYLRSYRYDAAGNLTRIRHNAPASGHSFSTDLTVSERSNRAVADTLAGSPAEVEALFTASGLQTLLSPGQALSWTPRGHLAAVTSTAGNLDEHYRYDSQGRRVLKITRRQNGDPERTHYLPQLELRSSSNSQLHVVVCGNAGEAHVRLLHWASGKPAGIANDQLRYSYADRLGSCLLELDQDGRLLSREEYYPYGGTSVWAALSQVEADCKTLRYSGKEQDATGLYYYGFRYYQPWLGRWLGADPAGEVDGLNLFRAMRNNPVTLKDGDGRAPEDPVKEPAPQHEVAVALPSRPSTIYSQPSVHMPYESRFNAGFQFIAVDLGEDYRIYLDTQSQADNLLITAHAGYLPWTGDVRIPEGMTISFYNPHGTTLLDPHVSTLFSGRDGVFVTLDSHAITPRKQEAQALLDQGKVKELSGTDQPSSTRNYLLSKYRDDMGEQLLHALSLSRFYHPNAKSDILMVRNRVSLNSLRRLPSLKGIFTELQNQGIHYAGVQALICRGNVLGRSKRFDSTLTQAL